MRATTTRRGYGSRHQKLRAGWERKMRNTPVLCARCGKWIDPDEPWDLGHDDVDRSVYTGPEHRACNRATAGRVKKRVSRRW